MEKIHKQILPAFLLIEDASAERFGVGLIHETYLVRAGEKEFILQKMNPIFPTDILNNIHAVSEFLDRKGWTVQRMIPAKDGKLYVKQGDDVWRLFTFIPGRVFERAENADMAYEAGTLLGKFHRELSAFEHVFSSGRDRQTPKMRMETFLRVTNREMSEELKKIKKIILELPELYLSEPKTKVAHGDPKISNIIWNEGGTPKAKAFIDLDECTNRGDALLELGDAFRSWCGKLESDPDNFFDTEKFEAALAGYREGSEDLLSEDEIRLIPRAIRLKTLELAARFMTDYFEDYYFGWNPKKFSSRKEHNLARVKGQMALYKSIKIQIYE